MAARVVVLAGDVGGTKCNLGLFEVAGGVPHPLRSAKYPSADYPGLAPLLEEFLGPDARDVRRPASESLARSWKTARALRTSPGSWTAARSPR